MSVIYPFRRVTCNKTAKNARKAFIMLYAMDSTIAKILILPHQKRTL
jgi:hypothetical protein